MGRAPGSYEEQTHPNVWLGGCPPLLEEQPPGELKPHRFMSEMEFYTRWLLACGSKERQVRELHEEGSGCQAELHEEGSNCQARPWTARAANGR